MNFGAAIQLVKEGKIITREGWNGKNLFVFRQVPAFIPMETVPKMQSLPDDVKKLFVKRNLVGIGYDNQLALVNNNNEISGWSPSTSDALAVDWKIYDCED